MSVFPAVIAGIPCRIRPVRHAMLHRANFGSEGGLVSSAVSVPYAPASAAAVRKRMRQELGRRALPADLIDDATLVLTELITNSLRHARPVDGGSVRTAWRFFGGQLEISVTDGGSSSVPHITPAPPDALGGRGMTIVN